MDILDIINKILFYSFLALGIFLLTFNIGKTDTIVYAFNSFIASWILTFIMKKKGINKRYFIFVNLAIWLNVFGELFSFYENFIYYDKILHFIVPFFITAIIYEYYLKSLKIKRDMIFLTVLGIICLWEIYEYLIVVFLDYPMMGVIQNEAFVQDPLDDTMIDLIYGMIGSLVYLIFKKEKIYNGIKNKIKKI